MRWATRCLHAAPDFTTGQTLRLASSLILIVAPAAAAALPPVPARVVPPAPPPIVIPDVKPPPPPVPPPPQVVRLPAGVMWVAQSDAPFAVVASPPELVTVTSDAGPMRVRGRFIESPDATVTKDFRAKYLVTVEAAAGQSGRVHLLVGTDLGSARRVCLDVGGGPPPGPGPGPAPDPALVAALQAAYAQEVDPGRAASLPLLAAFWRVGAKSVDDAKIQTRADLLATMTDAAKAMGVAGKLLGVQKVVQAEVMKVLPPPLTTPLDAAGRRAAADAFNRVAAALEAVKS